MTQGAAASLVLFAVPRALTGCISCITHMHAALHQLAFLVSTALDPSTPPPLLPRPGAVVGIVGGNGAGKSTLFRMIMNLDKPDGGQLALGDTVVPMYVDQSRDALDPNKTVRSGWRVCTHEELPLVKR